MKHSILIPLYNKAPYIARAIASLANQSCPPAELIIVDDCSTDGSFQILQQSLQQHSERLTKTDIKLIQLQCNRGASFARNVALDAATGDWISFFDADDEYMPGFCERIQSIFQMHDPELIILNYINLPSRLIKPVTSPINHLVIPVDEELLFLAEPLRIITWKDFRLGPGNNAVCRRSAISNLRYDEQSDYFECMDFWYRVIRQVLGESQLRCFLLLGEYLKIYEVENSLSRCRIDNVSKIKLPGLLERLIDSREEFDRRVWYGIATRWLDNILGRLETPIARLHFLWRFRKFIFRYYLSSFNAAKAP